MILNILAKTNQISPSDLIYFCAFAGIATVIIYISYIAFLKGRID